jgi:hypothetical protein
MLYISPITDQLLNVLSMNIVFLVVLIIIGRTVLNVIVYLIVRVIILSWKDWWTENWVNLLLWEVLSSRVIEVIVRHTYRLLWSNKSTRVSIRNMLLVLVVVCRHYWGLNGKILGGTLRCSALHTLRHPTKCWQGHCSAMQRWILVELLLVIL